jgi:hypothetical protein
LRCEADTSKSDSTEREQYNVVTFGVTAKIAREQQIKREQHFVQASSSQFRVLEGTFLNV